MDRTLNFEEAHGPTVPVCKLHEWCLQQEWEGVLEAAADQPESGLRICALHRRPLGCKTKACLLNFFCVMYWHWIVWMVFDDDLFCTVIAEADCCLKQSDVWKSKGARLPSAGTREILEWSKFKLWTCFCQCNARVIVVWLPKHVHSSFSLWTSAWLLITW